MKTAKLASVLALVVPAFALGSHLPGASDAREQSAPNVQESRSAPTVAVQYLEIVSSDVDATCEALEKLHGVEFGEPVMELGHARTAALRGGGRIGVRAPMRADEAPVVRPYTLVDDIEAAVKVATAAGAEFAVMPTNIPGQGTFAIYVLEGIQHGLWRL